MKVAQSCCTARRGSIAASQDGAIGVVGDVFLRVAETESAIETFNEVLEATLTNGRFREKQSFPC